MEEIYLKLRRLIKQMEASISFNEMLEEEEYLEDQLIKDLNYQLTFYIKKLKELKVILKERRENSELI